MLGSVNLGAATFELGKGSVALSTGFESDGVDALTQSLKNLNPSIATSKEELKDMTNLVERVNKQLQRVGPNSANIDKVMAAQRLVTSLRNQIGGRAGQLDRAAATGSNPPVPNTELPPKPVVDLTETKAATEELKKQREELERQFQAGEEIKQNLERQMKLLSASSDYEKERLQILFDLEDTISGSKRPQHAQQEG